MKKSAPGWPSWQTLAIARWPVSQCDRLILIIEKAMDDKQHIGHGFQLSAVVDWYLQFFYLERIRSANAVYIHLCIYSI